MESHVSGIWTIEGDHLESVRPTDSTDTDKWVRVMVGPSDDAGEESFDVHVCTPAWLQRETIRVGALMGRHLLIVEPWVRESVLQRLTKLFSGVSGAGWPDVAVRLACIGHGEFEDYEVDA